MLNKYYYSHRNSLLLTKKNADRHTDPAESGSQVSDKGEVVNETRIWEIESANRICAAWSALDHTENPSHKDKKAKGSILRTTDTAEHRLS
jgi:hypothetical protein